MSNWSQDNNSQKENTNTQQRQQQKVKKWSSISIKWFIIGCVGIFILFLFLFIWGLYWIISDPNVLEALWLEAETARNLLMVFAILFFGIAFFFSFFLLVFNLYRFFSIKTSKFKYIIWSIIWWTMVLFILVWWTISLIQINQLTWHTQVTTTNLVNPYLLTKDNNPELISGETPLIAPSYIRFQINEEIFLENIPSEVWNVQNIRSLTIDCNNWQTLQKQSDFFGNNWFFNWQCLFDSKDTYQIELLIDYVTDWQEGDMSTNVLSLDFDSKIEITIDWEGYDMNENRSEILVWNAPASVRFDAWSIFTDLWLPEINIEWDFTWDWEIDQEGTSNVAYTFREPRLNNIHYKLPDLSDKEFMFAVRTQESPAPNCNISYTPKAWNKFDFDVGTPSWVSAQSYYFEVYNIDSDDIEKEASSRSSDTELQLGESSNYIIYAQYETLDWQKWSCQTEEFFSWMDSYEIDYEISLQKWSSWQYQETDFQDGDLLIDVIPTDIRLEILWVEPEPEGDYDIQVLFDDDAFIQQQQNVFEYDFNDDEWEYELYIKITDSRWNEITETINTIVDEKPLIPILIVSPDEGEEPLEVNLDASASRVSNEDDRIVYFSWDFGDWETLPNSSQWQVSHTYEFDSRQQTWNYEPCVKVITRSWLEEEICEKVYVHREQRQANISVPSHPTQSARVWDRIDLRVNTDGNVRNIRWDFDNNRTVSWEGRSYANVSTTYEEPWDYRVRVELEYEDNPRVIWSVNLTIRE